MHLALAKRSLAVISIGICLLRGPPADASSAVAPETTESLAASFALEMKGELVAALRAAQHVADANSSRYFPRLRVAYLELRLKRYSAAVVDYGRAAELAPRSIEALLGKQQALVALGRFAEAEVVGRSILASDADNYLASSRLAWTLFNLGRYDEATKVYASVLALYPGDLEMATGLGYAQLRGGRKRDAGETFRAVLAISPANVRAREGLAACR